MDNVVNALINEIRLRKNYLNGSEVKTIYIGGGTPSLLSVNQLGYLFDAVYSSFALKKDTEITIELNPDDISNAYLENLRSTPVNRVSVGIQSFFDTDLKYLGRIHSASQSAHSMQLLNKYGFENISADLIYGMPDLSMRKWLKNLTVLDSYNVQHISAYALTVEERTILEFKLRRKKTSTAPESHYIGQYQLLKEFTSQRGYLHYEISNFARAGFLSRHNTSYWTGDEYIGIGPSAHSYNGFSRQWNFSRIEDYIEAMNQGHVFYEKEELSAKQKFNEYLLTGLRTMWGCDSDVIIENFGMPLAAHFLKAVNQFVNTGLIKRQGNTYILTDEGELLSDTITAEMFIGE